MEKIDEFKVEEDNNGFDSDRIEDDKRNQDGNETWNRAKCRGSRSHKKWKKAIQEDFWKRS